MSDKSLLDSATLAELRKSYLQSLAKYDKESTELWDALAYEDKLKVFYYVCKKIYEADVDRKVSYRSALYEVFNFNSDAYCIGIDCHYLELHNLISRACEL